MHIDGGIDHETQKATIIGEKRVLRERVGDAYDKTAEGWERKNPERARGRGEAKSEAQQHRHKRHENTTLVQEHLSCSNLKLNLKKKSVLKTKFYRVSIIHL